MNIKLFPDIKFHDSFNDSFTSRPSSTLYIYAYINIIVFINSFFKNNFKPSKSKEYKIGEILKSIPKVT